MSIYKRTLFTPIPMFKYNRMKKTKKNDYKHKIQYEKKKPMKPNCKKMIKTIE